MEQLQTSQLTMNITWKFLYRLYDKKNDKRNRQVGKRKKTRFPNKSNAIHSTINIVIIYTQHVENIRNVTPFQFFIHFNNCLRLKIEIKKTDRLCVIV